MANRNTTLLPQLRLISVLLTKNCRSSFYSFGSPKWDSHCYLDFCKVSTLSSRSFQSIVWEQTATGLIYEPVKHFLFHSKPRERICILTGSWGISVNIQVWVSRLTWLALSCTLNTLKHNKLLLSSKTTLLDQTSGHSLIVFFLKMPSPEACLAY